MSMRVNMQALTTPVVGAMLNNIQAGLIDINSGSLSNTTSITSVDTSKTLILHNGVIQIPGTGGAAFNGYLTYLVLTDSTTITAVRHITGGSARSRFTVIEFSSGIASVQRGTITIPSSPSFTKTKTATITSVDTSKSFINYVGHKQSNTGIENLPNIQLVNSTTIQAYSDNVNNTTVISYEVIEFE